MGAVLSTEIAAPRAVVWQVLTDVEAWPTITKSMKKVRWVTGDSVAVGNAARIKQPGLPTLIWTVTGVAAGESFAWQTSMAGVTTVGSHVLTAAPNGGSRLTLGIQHSGRMAGLVDALTGRRTRKFLRLECAGIATAATARATAA